MSDEKVSVDDKPNGALVPTRRIYVERFVSDNGCFECPHRTADTCRLFNEPLFTRQREGVTEYRVLDACDDAINADMADDAIRDARL